MEEKDLNSLPDEALDAVTGGASYIFNEDTGMYDVYRKNGDLFGSYAKKDQAEDNVRILNIDEMIAENLEGKARSKSRIVTRLTYDPKKVY